MTERNIPKVVPVIRWEAPRWGEPIWRPDGEIKGLARLAGVDKETMQARLEERDRISREEALDQHLREVRGAIETLEKWIQTHRRPTEDANEDTGEK